MGKCLMPGPAPCPLSICILPSRPDKGDTVSFQLLGPACGACHTSSHLIPGDRLDLCGVSGG